MAITTAFLSGFEAGLVDVSGLGLWNGLTGCTIQTTGQRSGSYCGRLTSAGSAARALKSGLSLGTQCVLRLAFKVITAPTGANEVQLLTIPSTAVAFRAFIDSSGQVVAAAPGGTSVTGPNVNDGAWHVLEMQMDWTDATPHADWKVDGVSQTQATGASASTSITAASLGSNNYLTNGTADFDDFIIGTYTVAATDWYGDGYIEAIVPGSDGTHSFTNNDFTIGDAGAGKPNTATDFWTVVEEVPFTTARSTTDNIRQAVLRTTAYVELKPATAPTGRDPANAIRALLSWSSTATQANTAGCIIRNSTPAATVIYGDLPVAQGGGGGALADYSESTNQFAGVIVTKPAAGWTNTEIDALRWRIGGSGDVTPFPTWQQLLLEVDWPVTAAPPAAYIPRHPAVNFQDPGVL